MFLPIGTEHLLIRSNQLMDMDIAHKPYSLYLMIRICQLKLYAKTGNKEQFESIYQEVTETYASIDEENQKRLAFEYEFLLR